MMSTLAILDLDSSPPCVVLVTDDDALAEATAVKYANQTGRTVTIVSGASGIVPPSSLALTGSPRLVTAADFASPADARRAGFNVPDEPPVLLAMNPSSRDDGKGASGDAPKTQPPKASK